ncbi:MAG: crAss001_48 related protein [Aeromonadaceae bacterium]
MQDWQKRVIEERGELSDKLDKLGRYIDSDNFKSVDARNRHLLETQWKAMSDYLVILDKRISIIQD